MYFFFLASYSYTNDRNFYLETLDYSNGDSVQYEYDQQGRVIKETYEDNSYVTYGYDNSGALATVYDSETGISTTYYYDLIDRMMKYVESGTNYSHSVGYEYDTINNLTQMVETINGIKRTTSYGYDDDNRVISITNDLTPDVADDGITESYTYDAFGRITTKVTKNGDTTVLTETYTYKPGPNGTLTSQIATHKTEGANYSVTYTYDYDGNGNITSVSDGTYATTYAYDSANQIIRENNQQAGKTYTWTYDNAGNIQNKKTYAYTTGTVGASSDTASYSYDNSQWRDLLTAYDGTAITYDQIGNPLSDGTWSYTWKQGRQLATLSDGVSAWTNTYNADGLRTNRTNGTSSYSYVYNGSQLVQMTADGNTLLFTYDASGTPQTVTYNGTTYFYATNLQGDITAILNASGETVVSYTYDAWGNHTSGYDGTGTNASTLGRYNPLRYRGYVYDVETELYYLQSRYYNPAIGRFINADDYTSTGQGILGNNMFAYCGNNPVSNADASGFAMQSCINPDFLGKTNEEQSEVLVLSSQDWIVSSKKMGDDLAAATGTTSSDVVAATDTSFPSSWNTTYANYLVIHMHGSPAVLSDNKEFYFYLNEAEQLQRNYNINYVLVVACSAGGSNMDSYNIGQMLSTKISPFGYVICATTTVSGTDSYFRATKEGRWVVYQNGNIVPSSLPTSLTMEDVAYYISNLF